jgi:hypothetical protein
LQVVLSPCYPRELPDVISENPPEQMQGEPVDARTDLFAFGMVLYEMAVGERLAPGARLSGSLPAELERIVSKCLENDREINQVVYPGAPGPSDRSAHAKAVGYVLLLNSCSQPKGTTTT